MEGVEVGGRRGDQRDGGRATVAGEVEGLEGATGGVERQRAAGEGHRTGAEGGREEAADGDRAGVDVQAAREGAARAAQGERAATALGEGVGAVDRAAQGERGGRDVEGAVAGEGDRALAEVEGAGAGEGHVATQGDRVGLAVDDGGAGGVVEDEGAGDVEGAGAEGLGVVEHQGARAGGDAAGEGVRRAEGQLGVAGLGQAARALQGLVEDDVAGAADGERAVDVDVVVDGASEGQGLAGDRRVEEQRAAGEGVDREVLADGEAAVVAEDLEGAAGEDAAGGVVGQLTEGGAVGEVGHDEAGARADGDDRGVVVGRGEELAGAGEVQRAARDGDVAGGGVGRVGQGQGAGADLGEGEGVAGLLGEETSEGRVGVLGADRERARVGVGRHLARAGQVADGLGGGRHRQGGAGVQGHQGRVRDAVEGGGGGDADLEADGGGRGDGHVAREGVGGGGADGGALGAGEGHVAGAGDAGVLGAVGAFGAQDDVAVERDAVEAERAGAGDAGGGAEGHRAGGAGGDDDRGSQVIAGGGAGRDEDGQVARGGGVADGQRAGAGAAEVGEVQGTFAEQGAAGVGVVRRAAEGQGAGAGLDDLGVAGERVADRAVQRVVRRRVGEGDEGRGQVAGEVDRVDRGRIVEGHDVAVDELVGQAADREVVGGVVEGAVDGAGPGELAVAELHGDRVGADRDGRGAAVAGGAGDGEEIGRGVGRAVGRDGERVEVARAARQADGHLRQAGGVDGEDARRGQRARGRRVDDKRGVRGEGEGLRDALPCQRGAGGDGEVGVRGRPGEDELTGGDVGRSGVGVDATEGQGAGAVLVEARGARQDDVEVLGRRGRGGDDAAALGRDGAAAEDVLLEGEAAVGALRVEDRALAGDGQRGVDDDGRARGRRVADRRAAPGHDAGRDVVGLDAELLGQVERAAGQVVLADGSVDRGARPVVEDDPRRRERAAGLVEDADAVEADVDTASLLGAGSAGRGGARGGVAEGQRAGAQVVGGDFATPVTDAQVVGDGDVAAGLVDDRVQARVVAEVEAAGLDGRAGVDVELGIVVGDAHAQDARGGVHAAQEEVDRTAVERHARAGRVDFDVGLGQVGERAAGDRLDLLAREEGVAVRALEAEDRLAGVAVDVEGHGAAAQGAAGGGVGRVADDQVRVGRRGARVDPDVVQGIGTDVVRAGQLGDGGVGLQAAHHEVVGVVRDLDRTGERAGGVVGGHLGVAGEGDGAREGRAAVDAEGADAARHPELRASGVVGEGGDRLQGRGGRAAAGGVGVLVARARDGDVVRERQRGVEHDLTAVLDDQVGRTELVGARRDDAGGAGVADGVVLGTQGQGAGVGGVGARKGQRALAGGAGLVEVGVDRAGAGERAGHGDVGAAADDAQGGRRGDRDERVAHDGGAGRGELERTRVDVGRAGVGVGAGERELARAGLGEGDGAGAVGDGAGEVAGRVTRREVGLVEVDGQERGGGRDAVRDRDGVRVALQAHDGLVEAGQVEGRVGRAAEVEHHAGGETLVATENHGVGLRHADPRGGAAAGVDHETVALAEGADRRVDVQRAGELQGVGQRGATHDHAARAGGVADRDGTGELGDAGTGLLQHA